MMRKLVIGVALILALGTTTIAFAKNNSNQRQVNRPAVNSRYSMMRQYRYNELARDIKDGDYGAMDDYMNNLSDEDYQRMIDRMREYGHGNMASRMERINRQDMISMHNARGGSATCFR